MVAIYLQSGVVNLLYQLGVPCLVLDQMGITLDISVSISMIFLLC